MSIPILLATVMLSVDLHFQRHDIADYPSPYQVAVADLNGDGKPDVLVLSTEGNRVDWFENPNWQWHPIARTERNIDLAPFDLDRRREAGNRPGQRVLLRRGQPGRRDPVADAGSPGQLWQVPAYRPRPGRASAPLG